MPEPAWIFFSYAHTDGVDRVYQQLKDRGYKPWPDREDTLGGEEWEPAIRTGIRESDLFPLCMSRHSLLRRGVLQKQIRIALDVAEEKLASDIFLIPVWIQAPSMHCRSSSRPPCAQLSFRWLTVPRAHRAIFKPRTMLVVLPTD